MRRRYVFAQSFGVMGFAPFEPFSGRLSGITATPTRSKMWRPCSKTFVCCCGGAAISLANGLRRGPANTNLHAKRARKAITDRIAGVIQTAAAKMDYRQRRFQSNASERPTPPTGVQRAAASGGLAARDGMNHQDFVLVARDFLH